MINADILHTYRMRGRQIMKHILMALVIILSTANFESSNELNVAKKKATACVWSISSRWGRTIEE